MKWTKKLKVLVSEQQWMKENLSTPYVQCSFYLSQRSKDRQLLHRLEMPRSFQDRWEFLILWREAKYICQYPFDDVRTYYHYFQKEPASEHDWIHLSNQLTAKKGLVTKVKRVLQEYKEKVKKENHLFYTPEEDQYLIKITTKLKWKEDDLLQFAYMLECLVQDLKIEVY